MSTIHSSKIIPIELFLTHVAVLKHIVNRGHRGSDFNQIEHHTVCIIKRVQRREQEYHIQLSLIV